MSLSQREIQEMMNGLKKKEPYKMEGHSFVPLKHVGKQYCRKCGLIALNNDFSQWCVRMGCNAEDHPQYASTRHRFTKPKWDV